MGQNDAQVEESLLRKTAPQRDQVDTEDDHAPVASVYQSRRNIDICELEYVPMGIKGIKDLRKEAEVDRGLASEETGHGRTTTTSDSGNEKRITKFTKPFPGSFTVPGQLGPKYSVMSGTRKFVAHAQESKTIYLVSRDYDTHEPFSQIVLERYSNVFARQVAEGRLKAGDVRKLNLGDMTIRYLKDWLHDRSLAKKHKETPYVFFELAAFAHEYEAQELQTDMMSRLHKILLDTPYRLTASALAYVYSITKEDSALMRMLFDAYYMAKHELRLAPIDVFEREEKKEKGWGQPGSEGCWKKLKTMGEECKKMDESAHGVGKACHFMWKKKIESYLTNDYQEGDDHVLIRQRGPATSASDPQITNYTDSAAPGTLGTVEFAQNEEFAAAVSQIAAGKHNLNRKLAETDAVAEIADQRAHSEIVAEDRFSSVAEYTQTMQMITSKMNDGYVKRSGKMSSPCSTNATTVSPIRQGPLLSSKQKKRPAVMNEKEPDKQARKKPRKDKKQKNEIQTEKDIVTVDCSDGSINIDRSSLGRHLGEHIRDIRKSSTVEVTMRDFSKDELCKVLHALARVTTVDTLQWSIEERLGFCAALEKLRRPSRYERSARVQLELLKEYFKTNLLTKEHAKLVYERSFFRSNLRAFVKQGSHWILTMNGLTIEGYCNYQGLGEMNKELQVYDRKVKADPYACHNLEWRLLQ